MSILFVDENLKSIRDLRANNREMLIQANEDAKKIIFKICGKEYEPLCFSYFHYLPSFWRLHLHLKNIESLKLESNFIRFKPLNEIINNLQYPDYYQKCDIQVLCPEKLNQYYK